MKRYSFFCVGFWPFLLCLVLITGIILAILLMFEWHKIEDDVAKNARQSLSSEEINWVTVETFNEGRTAILMGNAPNQQEADRALSVVKQARGVHKAQFHATKINIVPPTPAFLNAIVTQETIVLRGTVKDQMAIDMLIEDATRVFGKGNVLNKLSIGDDTAPLSKYSGLFKLIQNKGNSASFSASFVDNELNLNGQVINGDQKAAIGSALERQLNINVNNNLNVVLPLVTRDVCPERVNELMRNGKINFATGSSNIDEGSFVLLQNIADIAKSCSRTNFEVAGHTDSTGRLESNIRLSQQRAQSVATFLLSLGLPAEQFIAVGYGPNQPIADNASAEGRETNRRIEFRLNDTKNINDQNGTDSGEAQ